ncbi:hypothetical protein ERX37_04540 [Macrococcus hajekii]|uniref:Uncharacterized protein n=1 Tax=Macrococcus hajekii TaxID=198482 RepID=A0A4R6BNC3_9STAP|nr:hypothetical protein [Macrococcus hajekii]TDM03359.1 hypothetical protein ERX37_04540 [Macrococcus hajekii]
MNIKIKGFPNLEQLEVFNRYNFTFDNMINPKLLINDMKGKSLKEFYADKLTFKIFNISEDYVYYSGVMPRVESIELEDSDKAAPPFIIRQT